MRGSSHIVSISSGADRASEKNSRDMFRLLSPNWFSVRRLVRLISRLYTVGLIHTRVRFDSQTRGISITVGIMVFSIAGGLGFGRDLRRSCWTLLRAGRGPGLLRKRQRPGARLALCWPELCGYLRS